MELNYEQFLAVEDQSKITKLDFSFNGLTKLPDISKCTNLIQLDCSNNQLTEIPDLSKNINVICYNNPMSHVTTHYHGIKPHLVESVKNAVQQLMQKPAFIGPLEEFMIYPSNLPHVVFNVTYERILRCVLNYATDDGIYAILKEEMLRSKNVSFTAKIINIVNSLSGIQYTINSA